MSGSMWAAYESEERMRPIWEKVTDWCISKKDNIKILWNDADTQKNGLMNEGVIVAQTWDGPPIALKNEGQPVMYRAALEGAMAWVDGMSMPVGAENIEQAYAFIQHCYEAEPAGKAIDTHGYNSPVIGAERFANEQYAKNFARRLSRATRCRTSTRGRPRRHGTPTSARSTSTSSRARDRATDPGPAGPGSRARAGRRRGLTMAEGFSVELDRVSVQFGTFVAVRDANVRIEPGEFFTFLGPSGCGKTTILRTISGFLEPTAGRGADRRQRHGRRRARTAARPRLIFQNLALFPLMRVWENIAFALEVKGASTAARRRRADELLELIALPGQGDKLVSELSGGQKQRVAIARALCAEPRGAAARRAALARSTSSCASTCAASCARSSAGSALTFIYITHDQGEALTMSDHVAVMREGVIEQIADGRTIYDDPATAFVASFVGENNAFTGQVTAAADGMARSPRAVGPLRARIATAAQGRLQAGRPRHGVHPAGGAGPEPATTAGEDTHRRPGGGRGVRGPVLPSVPGRARRRAGQGLRWSTRAPRGAAGVGAALTVRFDPRKAVVLPPGELAEEE